ncbi:MAG: HD domain-containing protein [Woeseiaceae bacterium]
MAFTRMEDSTAEEWQIIASEARTHTRALPERIVDHLRLLDGDFGGYAVDRLTHSLQTATRAAKDGRGEEYVVCALLHDIGDTLGPMNHADIAGAIVKPFVSEQNHWMVANHAVIQGYYFFHYLGLDRNMRDKLKGHEYYDYTEEFCRKYDQNSFDPAYTSMSIDDFVPALRSVLAKPKHSILIKDK